MKLAVLAGLLLGLAGCATDGRPVPDDVQSVSEVRDLEGRSVNPFEATEVSVFIFLRTDCPISNRYAPEIERLKKKYTAEQVKFWLVYPDAETKASEIAAHLKEYSLSAAPLRDPGHQLVRQAGVKVTPEAAVFLRGGKELYHGRIDDRYVDFGKERPAPTRRDLDLVLQAALAGRPVPKGSAPAVGCYIAE
jgi:hypothetical protein